ncbi:hypothetical protein NON00_24685 [Roseomonas sp. GC11]|uniref:hypothetical protein n=1 Tax=Roseomonas sp. GC11 TaxID=2950546 RepID=UPI00210D6CCF|nr:hypothetical protein [Roseomonas sp. GC11]MCQ4163089.1 hypothetical protein [Roseomonas sp. GC11]
MASKSFDETASSALDAARQPGTPSAETFRCDLDGDCQGFDPFLREEAKSF